ncbi:GM22910 [Drosophila sechellia]|uniref:GM22910 n=1 Tax=Drosophila sechellia TaxID=7238 RepID=B4I6V6_DROSE|nr:GM22910 [Drosophila sechellia]
MESREEFFDPHRLMMLMANDNPDGLAYPPVEWVTAVAVAVALAVAPSGSPSGHPQDHQNTISSSRDVGPRSQAARQPTIHPAILANL